MKTKTVSFNGIKYQVNKKPEHMQISYFEDWETVGFIENNDVEWKGDLLVWQSVLFFRKVRKTPYYKKNYVDMFGDKK